MSCLERLCFDHLDEQLQERERLCWYCNHPASRLVPVLDVGLRHLKYYCLPCLYKSMKQYSVERKLLEIQDEHGDKP